MIDVLIADDHPIVLEGIRRMLEPEADLRVVAEARDGREAVDLCDEHRPHVAVVDFVMPILDGYDVVTHLAQTCPNTKVIILTMHDSEDHAIRLLRAGAAGFIPKGASADELVDAIRKVHAGGTYINHAILEKIGQHIGRLSEADPVSKLSERELQVLRKIAEGKRTSQIATELSLSLSTVHSYRYRVMKKLSIDTNSGLVRFALEKGLVT